MWKITKNSGHLRLCQQPQAAHALRSDQKFQELHLEVEKFQDDKSLKEMVNVDGDGELDFWLRNKYFKNVQILLISCIGKSTQGNKDN